MELQNQADKVFLALALWREARGESKEVRSAIGFVILNRVKAGGWWGTDITSVLFKKWQFSSLTDPKDKQLTTWPLSNDQSWQECLSLADAVINGKAMNEIANADSYYDISISAPKWVEKAKFVKQINKVKFYKVS